MSFSIKDTVRASGGSAKGTIVAESTHYSNSYIVEWEDGSSSVHNARGLELYSDLEATFEEVSSKLAQATDLLLEVKVLANKTGKSLVELHRSGDVDISGLEGILEGNGLYTSRDDSAWDSSAKCW